MSILNITYDKQDGSPITERQIITTSTPETFISGLDVTSLSKEDANRLDEVRNEYNDYTKLFMKNMFTFEHWCEITAITIPELKYRRFSTDKIEFV